MAWKDGVWRLFSDKGHCALRPHWSNHMSYHEIPSNSNSCAAAISKLLPSVNHHSCLFQQCWETWDHIHKCKASDEVIARPPCLWGKIHWRTSEVIFIPIEGKSLHQLINEILVQMVGKLLCFLFFIAKKLRKEAVGEALLLADGSRKLAAFKRILHSEKSLQIMSSMNSFLRLIREKYPEACITLYYFPTPIWPAALWGLTLSFTYWSLSTCFNLWRCIFPTKHS